MRVSVAVEPLLAVADALLLDLVGVLQPGELVHALAVDGALALLQRAFRAAVLGLRLDALGIDALGAVVELGLLLGVVGGERRALALEAGELVGQRRLLASEAGAAALRGGDALLLLLDARGSCPRSGR